MQKNYKGIGVKVLTPIIAIVAIMVITSAYTITTINRLRNNIDILRDQTLVELEQIQQIRYDILHTAEILTDASATHEEEGFNEAAEFSDEIHSLIAEIKKVDTGRTALWNDILKKYENFYELCKKMARAYIDEGLEAGNELMEQVDPVTDELSEIVDGATEQVSKEMEDGVNDVSSKITVIGVIYAVSSVFYIIVMVYLIYLIMGKMLKPITSVSDSLQKLASKDLTIDEMHNDQNDEIGGLVYAYNTLRSSLRDIMTNMDESTNQLEETSTSMASRSDMIKSNISDITRAVNNVAQLATSQASDIESSMTELTSLRDVAKQNEEASDKLAQESEKISAASQHGNNILDELHKVSIESENTFADIFGCIERIKESTEKIGEASNMIESIAAQTNLLSLNASIEAARAGDAGRGFAVVADEIRTLSDESSNSVNEINSMIKELRINVENATRQSENARDAVEKQVAGVANTRESYKEISDSLSIINKEISLLGDVSRAMTTGCDRVSMTMQNLSASAEENAANTEETTASVQEVLSMTEEIVSGTLNIKERTDALNDVVKTYNL